MWYGLRKGLTFFIIWIGNWSTGRQSGYGPVVHWQIEWLWTSGPLADLVVMDQWSTGRFSGYGPVGQWEFYQKMSYVYMYVYTNLYTHVYKCKVWQIHTNTYTLTHAPPPSLSHTHTHTHSSMCDNYYKCIRKYVMDSVQWLSGIILWVDII